MIVACDTREQKGAHVERQLQALGAQTVRTKLYVGDYARLDDMTLCIDRKKDLNEVESNLVHQHERFRAECIRAKENGIRLVVVVEHGHGVETLEDVRAWENPRLKRWEYVRGAHEHGKLTGVRIQPHPPASGPRIAAIMETMAARYGVEWAFCEKCRTGNTIMQMLCKPADAKGERL